MAATELEAASKFVTRPRGHAVHPEVPVVSALYVPWAHEVHVAEEAAPARLLYAPAGQPVHTEASGSPASVP